MKFSARTIVIASLALSVQCGLAAQLDENFIRALNAVESSGKHSGVPAGDNGAAIGPFQIHRSYWEDAKVGANYESVTNYTEAVQCVEKYLNRYARSAVARHDYESLARIHNGGPRGAEKAATLAYWEKVKKHLK